MDGQRTFIMAPSDEDGPNETKMDLVIRDASGVLEDILEDSDRDIIDLLHVNCEGCEWEMLERIIETDLQSKIR